MQGRGDRIEDDSTNFFLKIEKIEALVLWIRGRGDRIEETSSKCF